jgi:hypothetical protein
LLQYAWVERALCLAARGKSDPQAETIKTVEQLPDETASRELSQPQEDLERSILSPQQMRAAPHGEHCNQQLRWGQTDVHEFLYSALPGWGNAA